MSDFAIDVVGSDHEDAFEKFAATWQEKSEADPAHEKFWMEVHTAVGMFLDTMTDGSKDVHVAVSICIADNSVGFSITCSYRDR